MLNTVPNADSRGTTVRVNRYLISVVMFLFFSATSIGNEALPSGVQVVLDSHKPLSLRVTVTSHAKTRVNVVTWRLPWGRPNGMILVAVTRGEEYVERNFQEAYPDYRRVTF